MHRELFPPGHRKVGQLRYRRTRVWAGLYGNVCWQRPGMRFGLLRWRVALYDDSDRENRDILMLQVLNDHTAHARLA